MRQPISSSQHSEQGQLQQIEQLADNPAQRNREAYRARLGMRALAYLEHLVAYEDTGRTVEQLLDAGEQLLQEDERLQSLTFSIRQAHIRHAQRVQQYRRQWQPLVERLEQPLAVRQQQPQMRMGSLEHQQYMQRRQQH